MSEKGGGGAAGGGIGFLGALAILFIALKLTGYIDWSWWWVLSPLYPAALLLAPLVVLLIMYGIAWMAEDVVEPWLLRWKRWRGKKWERLAGGDQ
jgi:hypothetical protein